MKYLDEIEIKPKPTISKRTPNSDNCFIIHSDYIEYNGCIIISHEKALNYFNLPNTYVYESEQSLKITRGESLFKNVKPYKGKTLEEIIKELCKRKKISMVKNTRQQ